MSFIHFISQTENQRFLASIALTIGAVLAGTLSVRQSAKGGVIGTIAAIIALATALFLIRP